MDALREQSVESDHGRLSPDCGRCAAETPPLRPGDHSEHAFVQNLRRGHYELGVEEVANLWVLAAFDELTLAI